MAEGEAVALLSHSPVGNMLANVFLAAFGDKNAPTKLFSSETEAIAWLKGFRT